MLTTGQSAPIKMIAYLRQQAKPRKIFPTDPQEVNKNVPTQSVGQLRMKNEARQAEQRALTAPNNQINPNLLDEQRGALIARKAGHMQMNFEAYDAQRENIEASLDNQIRYQTGKDLYAQTAEKLALQRSMGTSHAELQPNQLGDITAQYNKFRVLVQQNTNMAQQAQSRAMQRVRRGRNLAPRTRGNARLAFKSGYQVTRQ